MNDSNEEDRSSFPNFLTWNTFGSEENSDGLGGHFSQFHIYIAIRNPHK